MKSVVTHKQAYLTLGREFFILITWRTFFIVYIYHQIGSWDKALRILKQKIICFE